MTQETPPAATHAERLGRADAVPAMLLSSLIWRTGSLLTSYVTRRLDEQAGLPLAEAEVLMATRVRGEAPTTPRDLRSQLNLTSAGITKRIDQVEARGFLERRPHPDDRRSVTLHLTPEGARRADETISTVASVMADLVQDRFSDDDLSGLNAGLSQLAAALELPES